MTTIVVDDQQHATLIAALNFYHDQGQGDPAYRTDWIHHLATNGDQVISLDAGGINRLIEQINFCGGEWLEAFKKEFDEKLAGMSDEELIKSFEEIGCAIVISHSNDDDDEDDDFDDDNVCRECGEPNDDGEGYDGLCGNCADMATCNECGGHLDDPVEDIDERLCGRCRYSTCGDDSLDSTSGTEVDVRKQCWDNAAKDDSLARADDEAFINRAVAIANTPQPEINNAEDIPS